MKKKHVYRCWSQCWEVPWISPPGPGWSVRTFADTLSIFSVKQSHWEGELRVELYCPCHSVWREKMSTSWGMNMHTMCQSLTQSINHHLIKHLPSLWYHVTFVCVARTPVWLTGRYCTPLRPWWFSGVNWWALCCSGTHLSSCTRGTTQAPQWSLFSGLNRKITY